MTRVLFKRPVRIGGVSYEGGREHEAPAALVDHWYTKALVKDGLAQIIEDKKPEPAPAPAPAPKPTPKVEAEVKPVVSDPAPKPEPAPKAEPKAAPAAPKPAPKPVKATTAAKKTTGKK